MKKIIHFDADCFFAALEMREKPDLREKPIAVGGDPGRRGVISTCNYEARRYGVRSAMASAQAMRLCPSLEILPPNFALYKTVSRQMRDIFHEYSDLCEPLSIDEAFVDVSLSQECKGSATLIAHEIQQRIFKDLGISVSAGVSSLKYVAKIASDWRKPAGLFTVAPNQVYDFVAKLPVQVLPGVGPVFARSLLRLGIQSCADVRSVGLETLVEHFGKSGLSLYQMAIGEYDRDVQPVHERKSLSIERTFAEDFAGPESFTESLPALLEGLQSRYRNISQPAPISKRSVKLKFEDFSQTTVETSLSGLADVFQFEEFQRLACVAWHRKKMPVRLIGLGLGFKPEGEARQLPLF
jgi:DNA polymerase-4